MKRYYPASNEAARLRNIAADLLRSNNLSIYIKYLSSGEIGEKEVYLGARSQWLYYRFRREDADKCYRFIDKDIGYITLKNIEEEDIPVIKEEFMKTRGIIIDIRNAPSIFSIIHRLASYFVRSATPFAKFTTGNSDNSGAFIFKGEYKIAKSESENIYQGKLVVIVNEESQSLAEFNTMAFQAGDNTTVVGSPTAGADGYVSEIVLPGGLRTLISGVGFYYPDGRNTQRIGIVPDREVKPTVKGIREGRDELLEKAIEIIRQE
jgi:C-terminal processing protease CtpA/Prc